MAEERFLCAQEDCLALATWFYFTKEQRRPVCNLHFSASTVQAYPIAGFHFITHPNKALLYHTRCSEVERLRNSLKRLKSKAKRDVKAAFQQMEENGTNFEMHKKRTLKCLEEVERSIDECQLEIPNYLLDSAFQLSDACKEILDLGYIVPTFQVSKRKNVLPWTESQTEAHSQFLETESMIIDETFQKDERQLAQKLLKKAKIATSIPREGKPKIKDFLDLQRTYQECCFSIALCRNPEAVRLQESMRAELLIQKSNWERERLHLHFRELECTITEIEKKCCRVKKGNDTRLRTELAVNQANLKNSDFTEIQRFEISIQIATALYQLSRYSLALKYLNSAHQLSKKLYPSSLETVSILNKQACCYMSRREFSKVSTRFRRSNYYLTQALTICEERFPHSKEMVETLHNQGMCYLGQNKCQLAEAVFQRGVEICLVHFPYRVEMVAVLNGLGCVYLNTFLWYKAERCFERAYFIARKYFPGTFAKFLTLSNLGYVSLLRKELEAAIEYFKAAFQCGIDDTKECPSIFTIYARESSVPFTEAMEGFKLAIVWLEQQQQDSDQVVRMWIKYADLKRDAGVRKLGEAKHWLEKALDNYSFRSPKGEKTSEILFHLVSFHHHLNQSKSAEQCFEDSMIKRALSFDEIASEYKRLGIFHCSLRRRKDVIRSYKLSLHYQAMGSQPKKGKEVYQLLGTEYAHQKQYPDIEKCRLSIIVRNRQSSDRDLRMLRNCYQSR